MSSNLPSLDALKAQAKDMRGPDMSHSQSLEAVARVRGYRDWNTLHAAVGNRVRLPKLSLGMRLSGRYLGHVFTGELIGVRQIGSYFRLTIRFEAPVNVSAFDSMKVMRKQINAQVDEYGVTVEKLSNGTPHLALTL